ncbi:hypothetical protein RISK_004572 [Rhodopirellula islandica]|uniref:Uncharacterized protein n=1 Tax=Rhodopirellula islandica TaxID=595434 RepID=A0A0J1B8V7_RHOIS|nr:hypothetical protein RISK_004572 [Rhodopirellula islandica]
MEMPAVGIGCLFGAISWAPRVLLTDKIVLHCMMLGRGALTRSILDFGGWNEGRLPF